MWQAAAAPDAGASHAELVRAASLAKGENPAQSRAGVGGKHKERKHTAEEIGDVPCHGSHPRAWKRFTRAIKSRENPHAAEMKQYFRKDPVDLFKVWLEQSENNETCTMTFRRTRVQKQTARSVKGMVKLPKIK